MFYEGFKTRNTYYNVIVTDSVKINDEKILCYNIKNRYIGMDFLIIHCVSGFVTLVLLMKNPFNVIHAVTIYGVCIFEKKKKASIDQILFGCDLCRL